MKLLTIFRKDIEISLEKLIIHSGHSNRMATETYINKNTQEYNDWRINNYKNVLLEIKTEEQLQNQIKKHENNYIINELRDAGLDNVYEKNTLLGISILIKNEDQNFKRLRNFKY